MDQKQLVAQLIEKARKYRGYARWVGDRQTVKGILALAAELRDRARALAHPDEGKIRNRAREIWEENGRPQGRDLEFWLQANGNFRTPRLWQSKSGTTASLELLFAIQVPNKAPGRRSNTMAVNKPVGDTARKGAVKKRTQRKTAVMGKPAWTKRDKTSGEFMAVKKSAKKFKGVRREKA